MSSMIIVADTPPNYAQIVAKFPIARDLGTIFTYGDTIYYRGGQQLGPGLMAHEAVHSRQQREIGGPENWWIAYLGDPRFRFEQELEAHREEYRVESEGQNRAGRRRVLKVVAKRLSSGLYNHMISEDEAKRLIADPSST